MATSKAYSRKQLNAKISTNDLKLSYQFARIINHHQGFSLIGHASDKYGWGVDLSEIARIWTNGCIIKSDLMKEFIKLLRLGRETLLNPTIMGQLNQTHDSIKKVVEHCIVNEIHAPCLTESLSYFHGFKTADSPANLIQAQRDYFGAHTYQLKNDPSGKFVHTIWASDKN